MPHNPFADDLFWPVVLRVVLALVLGLVAVVLSERKPLRVLRRSTLFSRLRTWLWVAPLFLLSAFTGGFVLAVVGVFVAVQVIGEWVRMVGLSRRYALLLMLWAIVGIAVGAYAHTYFPFLVFGFFIVLTLIPILSGQVEGAARQVAATLFGYVYLGLPFAFIALVKTGEPWGLNFLVVVTIAVAISDVTAFVVGTVVRTPRVFARLSGGKTWSASLGNLLGAAAALALLWVAVPAAWTGPAIAALAVAVGVGCIWGDLSFAFLRRDFAVKETGSRLFGFGGFLERIDSLLFAVPLGYYALLLANQIAR